MEKPFRKTGNVMNVPLLKRFCEGGVFGWWETVAERVIQFSQPRPLVPFLDASLSGLPISSVTSFLLPYLYPSLLILWVVHNFRSRQSRSFLTALKASRTNI